MLKLIKFIIFWLTTFKSEPMYERHWEGKRLKTSKGTIYLLTYVWSKYAAQNIYLCIEKHRHVKYTELELRALTTGEDLIYMCTENSTKYRIIGTTVEVYHSVRDAWEPHFALAPEHILNQSYYRLIGEE